MTRTSDRPELTVVVLAYNEEENVERAVDDLVRELSTLDAPWELLLVDDGSTDRTGAIADAIAAREPRVRVIHHGGNRGLGGGYMTGFTEACGELLIFNPADGQFPPDIVTTFFREMKKGELDMLLGYLPVHRRSPIARSLSAIERVLYRSLLGKMPRFQGVLMFKTSILEEIPLTSRGKGWGIIMELVLRASRGPYRLRSTPTEMRPRMSGESKVQNTRTIVANLKQLMALRRTIERTPADATPLRKPQAR